MANSLVGRSVAVSQMKRRQVSRWANTSSFLNPLSSLAVPMEEGSDQKRKN